VARTVADGVSTELDRRVPGVPQGPRLVLEERVPPRSRKEHEEVPVPNVLHVREPRRLAPGSRGLANREAVLRDELRIDLAGLALGTCKFAIFGTRPDLASTKRAYRRTTSARFSGTRA
jgi:hypothetical protein